MTTGNAAAMTMNVGAVAPAPPTQEDCEELEKRNDKERTKVSEQLENKSPRTQEEDRTLQKASGTGMTLSSATSSVPGAGGSFSACSSGCAQAANPSGLVTGGTSEQKMGLNAATRASSDPQHDEAKEAAGVLCDKSYVHPGGGKGAHAEPKIFNQMSQDFPDSAMRGGSVVLNIDWRFMRNKKPQQSGMPCGSCYKMLCHAAKECDIQIFICDRENNPQPLPKDCEADGSYQDLCQRVDGNMEPGR